MSIEIVSWSMHSNTCTHSQCVSHMLLFPCYHYCCTNIFRRMEHLNVSMQSLPFMPSAYSIVAFPRTVQLVCVVADNTATASIVNSIANGTIAGVNYLWCIKLHAFIRSMARIDSLMPRNQSFIVSMRRFFFKRYKNTSNQSYSVIAFDWCELNKNSFQLGRSIVSM